MGPIGRSLLTLAIVAELRAQTVPIRIGPGVTPPRVIKKIEPDFSPSARADRIQGTVVLQVVVTEQGTASDIKILSPLGFGLDEEAVEAIQKWKFTPAVKAGAPVPVIATIEVNFRFPGLAFDEGYETRRTNFNLALQRLRRNDPKTKEDSVKTMLALAKQGFPAALYAVGTWEIAGENEIPKDQAAGLAKVQQAADKNYGPAIYEIAMESIRDQTQGQKAWDKMRLAATLGSQGAQFFLGDRYERGEGVEQNADRAKNYFRLGAAQGNSECQFRLARLMFDAPHRRDYEYEQALAWFQLASDQGVSEAKQIVEREAPNLTAAQRKSIDVLKGQFTRNLH